MPTPSHDPLASLKASLRQVRRSGELEVHERVDLTAWTGLRVGGMADVVIRCHTVQSVQVAVDLMAAHGRQWVVLGAGSSVVPPDVGLRCPILKLSGALVAWELDGDHVVAGAGANLTQLCRAVALQGCRVEPFGRGATTVGAALLDLVAEPRAERESPVATVEIARPGVAPVVAAPSDDGIAPLLEGGRRVVVRCRLPRRERVEEQGVQLAQALRQAYAGKTVGGARGVFHDPGSLTADSLLTDAGVQGLAVGGARVADDSANSILTSHRCTAADVVALCRNMRERVRERIGVVLEPRLRFLDEVGERVEL
jgi:UDP-N-acetylmuramate dehydrogenase